MEPPGGKKCHLLFQLVEPLSPGRRHPDHREPQLRRKDFKINFYPLVLRVVHHIDANQGFGDELRHLNSEN